MKLLIFILTITLLPLSQTQNGGWSVVPSSEVNTSPEIQKLLDFGVKYVTGKAVKDLKVPDTLYEVVKIGDVSRQVGRDQVKYNISLNLDNNEGTKISTNFTVQYQPSRDRARVRSYTYTYTITETACENDDPTKVDSVFDEGSTEEEAFNEEESYNEEESAILGGWQDVDLDELTTNKEIQDLLNFGAPQVVEGAIKDGNAPDSQYTIVDVYRIRAQVVSGIKYKFYVKLDNGQGTTIKAIFVVYYQSWTGRKDVTCYRYSAFTKKSEGQGNEEEVVPTEEEAAVVEEKKEEEEEETKPVIVGGWSQVDLSEVENSVVIQDLLNLGADYVTKKAIQAGKIPDSEYEVAQIYSVQRQVVSGLNYKFEVRLDNGEGTTVNATYVIWFQAWTNKKSVTSYTYTSLTKELDCDGLDPNKIDYPAEDEELPNEESNEELSILTKDYSVVDLSEVIDNEEIQNLLDLGVDAVIKGGMKDGKIPNSNFKVTEIYRIWRRALNGIKYKFHVKLDDGKGVTVNAIFVVYEQAWSEKTKVTCFKYSVSKKKK